MTRPRCESMADRKRPPILPRMQGHPSVSDRRHRRDSQTLQGRDAAAWESRIELILGGL